MDRLKLHPTRGIAEPLPHPARGADLSGAERRAARLSRHAARFLRDVPGPPRTPRRPGLRLIGGLERLNGLIVLRLGGNQGGVVESQGRSRPPGLLQRGDHWFRREGPSLDSAGNEVTLPQWSLNSLN